MQLSTNELASWASILATVAAILGLIQSVPWLTGVGVCIIGIAIFALLQAQRGRKLLRSAAINLAGQNLDSLNIANLRRRVNRTLVVQRAYHLARIDGPDLTLTWRYDGYCSVEKETSIEFSVDSEINIPFSELSCYGFDLLEDPDCLHRIRPVLLGADGLSKKLSLPFLKPLQLQQPFSVVLHCELPGAFVGEARYYTSTLSFEQHTIPTLAVHLIFTLERPRWVRAYECGEDASPSLLSELRPVREDQESSEYIEILNDVAGQSARIYSFHVSPRMDRVVGGTRTKAQKSIS
jgi:hypothetical protein